MTCEYCGGDLNERLEYSHYDGCPSIPVPPVGTCQQCGRYTTDRYCFATDGCKELGGADVL